MKDLKNYIMLFCGVCLFQSCFKTEIDKGIEEAIVFSSTTSRAVIENDFPEGASFSVWGWYSAVGEEPYNIFDGISVTKSASGWDYEGTQYWLEDRYYDFYAIYPENFGTVEQNGTIKVENFDCSKTGEDAVDLMTAARQNMSGSSSQIVNLNFSHILSRVNIIAVPMGGDIYINTVKLAGIKNKGTYNSAETAAKWGSFTDIKEFTKNNINLVNGGVSLFSDMLLIPQTLSDANVLTLSCIVDGSDKEFIIDLSQLSVKEWEIGESYKYSITIKGEYISFDVSVMPWKESMGGIITVD